MTTSARTAFFLAAPSIFALVAGGAHAVNLPRSFVQNATGACQSALPVFEGQIRKRPLALQNEGAAPAFVSCSLMGTDRSVAGITEIAVFADNNTAGPVGLNCTLVTGLSKFGAQQFLPETINIAANDRSQFVWTAADNGGAPFNNFTVNVSCNLPVGVGLSMTRVRFDQDVGA